MAFNNSQVAFLGDIKRKCRSVRQRIYDSYPVLLDYADNMFISGGAIASLIQQASVNDWDIYFKDAEVSAAASTLLEKYYRDNIKDVNPKYQDFVGKDGKLITANAITMEDGLQFITMINGDPKDVRASFDYVHCMPYYDFNRDALYISEKQYDACWDKKLIVNNQHVVKPWREEKFLARGYTK